MIYQVKSVTHTHTHFYFYVSRLSEIPNSILRQYQVNDNSFDKGFAPSIKITYKCLFHKCSQDCLIIC